MGVAQEMVSSDAETAGDTPSMGLCHPLDVQKLGNAQHQTQDVYRAEPLWNNSLVTLLIFLSI